MDTQTNMFAPTGLQVTLFWTGPQPDKINLNSVPVLEMAYSPIQLHSICVIVRCLIYLMPLMKLVNSIGSRRDPQGTQLSTVSQVDSE